MLLAIALFSSIGGFLLGYDLGVIAGALLSLRRDVPMSDAVVALVVAAAKVGAVVGAILGGAVMLDRGRKPAMRVASLFFIAGPVCLAFATSAWALLLGRCLVGVGIGVSGATLVPVRPRSRGERRSLRTFPGASLRPHLAFNPDTPRRLSTPLLTPLNASTPTSSRMERPSAVATPAFIGELAPAARRGALVSTFELAVCAGMVVASLVNYALVASGRDGGSWRLMLAAPAAPAAVFLWWDLRVAYRSPYTGPHTTAFAW